MDISHLSLTKWPPELVLLARVRSILAQANKLTIMPSIGMTFKNLEFLNLSRNELTNVDDIHFREMTFLKKLDLSRNKLVTLPSDIIKLPQLTILYVQNNKLIKFPDNMKELRSLNTIDASANDLVSIGEQLEYIPNLEDLNLKDCKSLKTGILDMGTRTRRLYEKRILLTSKIERRSLITRALNIQKTALIREQNIIYQAIDNNDKKYP